MYFGNVQRDRLMLTAMLAGCYIAMLYATTQLRATMGGSTTLWSSNAFVIAAMLLLPRRWAVGCALLCYAAQVGLTMSHGRPVWYGLLYSSINMAEALAIAALAQMARVARLTSPGRVAKLMFLVIAPVIAASTIVSAIATSLIDHLSLMEIVRSRLPAKFLGYSLFVPAILLLVQKSPAPLGRFRKLETVGLFVLIAALSILLFTPVNPAVLFMLFPAIAVVGLRVGPRAVAGATAICCAIVLPLGIALPGRVFDPEWALSRQILMIQVYVSMVFLTGLTTALVARHQQRLRELFARRSQAAMRSRDRARAASVAKSEFLATMSHEIRTPLNSILGFAQVLDRREDLPADASRQIELIERSGAALLTVVNDILDFSKVEAGRLDLDPKPVALAAMARDALAMVAASAEEKGLTLSLNIEGDTGQAHTIDDHRLRQILLNFLNNAVKFTDAGEVALNLSIKPQEGLDQIRFAVSDTGVGISPDAQQRLFQRFSQVDNSISRHHGGTGLGLAICRGLAELMGGKVGVSTREGEGSVFWLEIDLERAEAPCAMSGADYEEQALSAHVLVVDDHPMNRELAATVLALIGCSCELAVDGRSAVAAAAIGRFDAIFMDIHMPGMDGLAATRAIRNLPGPAARVPIIAMSADVLPEHLERCRASGMVDSVGKPIDIAALHACLTRWVGRDADGRDLAA